MTLTPRQRELLALLAAGHTAEAIAERYGIQYRAAAYRIQRLCHQIGARTPAHAVAIAITRGHLPPGLIDAIARRHPDPDAHAQALRNAARSWPADTLRAAHAAYERGERWDVVLAGEREYQRRRKARARGAAA
jgi:DNA-binding CsgD family transcriptional regulator